MDLLSSAFSLIMPYACLVCGRPLAQGYLCSFCLPPPEGLTELKLRCPICHSRVSQSKEEVPCEGPSCTTCRLSPSLFRFMRYLYLYQDQASVLVSTMKYRPSLALCRTAAALLSEKLDLLFENRDWDAIVPVPPSRASLRLRGFAPCDVMATLLAANSKPKQRLYLSALRHCGSNTPQAALPPAKRRLNVARAFAADPKYVQGRRILLLDDVLTTGATSQACALALQQAGVFSVDLLNLCRAPNWNRYRLGALQRGNHE